MANPHPPTTTLRTHSPHLPLPPANLHTADRAPSRHKVKNCQNGKNIMLLPNDQHPGPTSHAHNRRRAPRTAWAMVTTLLRPQESCAAPRQSCAAPRRSTQPLTSSDQKPTQTTDRQLPVHSTGHRQVPGTDTEPAATVLQAPTPTAPPACQCTCNVPGRRKRATRPGCAPGHQPPDCMRHDPTGAESSAPPACLCIPMCQAEKKEQRAWSCHRPHEKELRAKATNPCK